MCLTPTAYQERKRGQYPGLRQALEDKEIPSDYYGLMSADDNTFDSMNRLIEISALAVKHEQAIKDKAESTGREEMRRDLRRLGEALARVSEFLKFTRNQVKMISDQL